MKKMVANKTIFVAGFVFFFIILAVAMSGMREFGQPISSEMDDHFILHGQEETGANNIVTSVVFDYRGFDTLGEATILFAAVLGISVLLDQQVKKTRKKDKKTKSKNAKGRRK